MCFLRLTKVRFIPYCMKNRFITTAVLNYCKPNLFPKEILKTPGKDVKKEAIIEAENVVAAAMNAARESTKVANKDPINGIINEVTKESAKVSAILKAESEVAKDVAKDVSEVAAKMEAAREALNASVRLVKKEAAAHDAMATMEAAWEAANASAKVVKKETIKDAAKVAATMEETKATPKEAIKELAEKVSAEAAKEAVKVTATMEAAKKLANDSAKKAAMEASRAATNMELAKKASDTAMKAAMAAKEASEKAENDARKKATQEARKEAAKVKATMESARHLSHNAIKKPAKESINVQATMAAQNMSSTIKSLKETAKETSKEATKDAAKMGATNEAANAAAKKSGNGGAKDPPNQPPQEKKAPRWKDFRVYRWNPEEPNKPAGLQTFKLDLNECGHMVLDALFKIKNDIDPTFTFRRSCREGICGSCSMNINGVNTLACTTAIDQSSKPLTVYPLPHMYVVRDLVVDMTQFYAQYHYIEPWLQRNDEDELKKANREVIQAPEDRIKVEMPTACILCACCTTACPTYWWHNDKFLGPAAILNAYRWVIDSRDQKTEERLAKMNDRFKVLTCHSIWNCTKTCPKGLNPAETVHKLRLMIVGMSKKETPKIPKDDYKPKTLAELKEK